MTTTIPSQNVATTRERLGPLERAQHLHPRAEAGTARGFGWAALLAANFFLMSNPLVFIATFDLALHKVLILTVGFLLGHLLWTRVPGVPVEILLFLGFAALSWFWSISRPATVHAVELYVLVAAVALLIAANVTVPVLVNGLAWGGVLVVVGSLYALHKQLPGAIDLNGEAYMAGVGTNRNILAYTLVLSLAAVVSVIPRTVVGKIQRLVSLGIILLGIYLSSSGTGYIAAGGVIATATLLLGFELLRSLASRRTLRIARFGFAVGASVLVFFGSTIATWLGRDAGTLSGRVPLWKAIVHVTEHGQVWIGYGWGAVWGHPWQIAPPNALVDEIYARGGLVATHGHNSFFDVLPQLGVLGVVLSLAVFLRTALRAASLRRRSSPDVADLDMSRFLLVGLVGLFVFGLTEPLLTIPVGWFVLVMLTQQRSRIQGSRRTLLRPSSAVTDEEPGA